MTEDFRDSRKEQLYEKFNINWIKVNSSKNKLLVNHKAPFLAAILDSLELIKGKRPTVNITLKDKSGNINGTVLYSLYEEYADFFTISSVLVLKQFGVLSMQNSHCITITPNNLVNIYHREKLNTTENKKESIKKIVVQQCSIVEIWKKYQETITSYEKNHSNLVLSQSTKNNISTNSVCHIPVPNVLNDFSISPNYNKHCNSSENFHIKSTAPSSNTSSSKNKFTFKNVNVSTTVQNKIVTEENADKKGTTEFSLSCSQISVKVDKQEHSEIWKNLFEEVDPDSLLDDF